MFVSRLGCTVNIKLLIKPKESLMPFLKVTGWDNTVTPANKDDHLKEKNRLVLYNVVTHLFSQHGLRVDLETLKCKDWDIGSDGAISEVGGFWNIALSSNVMLSADSWQNKIYPIFWALNDNCSVATGRGCSMHIHVFPAFTDGSKYTIGQLIRVMRATAYYDDSSPKTMDATQKNDPWAKSNKQPSETLDNLKNAYLMVPAATSEPFFSIFKYVNADPVVYGLLGYSRYMMWNFNTVDIPSGVIECIRHSSPTSDDAARHWIAFAPGFISQAIETDADAFRGIYGHASVNSLLQFVHLGTEKLEPTCQDAIKNSLIVKDRTPPVLRSVAEIEALKREKKKKRNAFVGETHQISTPSPNDA